MAGTNLGVDLYCIDDLDPALTLVSGTTALAHAAARRLGTDPGWLFYDAESGYDARNQLHRPQRKRVTSHACEAQLVQDERVRDAMVEVEYRELADPEEGTPAQALVLKLTLATDYGPFALTLGVDEVTISILDE
jgi:hypothetical protein